MTRKKLSKLWPLMLVSALVAVPATASTKRGVLPKPLFGTPGTAAYCYVTPESPVDLRPVLLCWTPNDGWSAAIGWSGRRAFTRYYTKPPAIVHDLGVLKGYTPRARLLSFGQRWSYRCGDPKDIETCDGRQGRTAFTCASRSTGLTCTNAAKHGFWIGRYRGYRLF